VIGGIYPSYAGLGSTLGPVVRPFQKLFLGEQIDIFTAAGAFTLPFRHPLVLATMAVVAVIPAAGAIAGERERGGLDLLLATRLERRALVATVFLATLPGLLLLAVACVLGAALGASVAGVRDGIPLDRYALIGVNFFAVSVFFAALGLLLSVLSGTRGRAVFAYSTAVIGFFLVSIAAESWRGAAWLRPCTPLGYIDAAHVLNEGGPSWMRLAGLAVTALALAALSRWAEHRRRSV
jgi:ABC-type transport system involved in multi-copper enzyme maturation permease subunit